MEDKIISIGLNYFQNKQYDLALNCFEQILLINQDNTNCLLNKGFILQDLNRLQEANECFDKIIKINKNTQVDIDVYNLKGYTLQKMNNIEEAKNCYLLSLSLNPYNYFTYILLSSLYFKIEEYEKALEILAKSIEIDSTNKFSIILKTSIENKITKTANKQIGKDELNLSSNLREGLISPNFYNNKKEKRGKNNNEKGKCTIF